MKSDYEKLISLLEDFGVEYSEKIDEFGCLEVVLAEGCRKISGYSGFFATIRFNKDHNFVSVGVWE